MAAVVAQIQVDPKLRHSRAAVRRVLRLEVDAANAEAATRALLHNLSETGVLLETGLPLRVGDRLRAELPHAGATDAVIVRARGSFFGCAFVSPISKAAVSAALLLSPAQELPEPMAESRSPTIPLDGLEVEEEPQASELLIYISLLLGLAAVAIFLMALFSLPLSMR